MQIDNEVLKKISTMNDADFIKFIASVAGENGIAIQNLSQSDLARIRSALGGVSKGDPTVMKAIDDASQAIKKKGK